MVSQVEQRLEKSRDQEAYIEISKQISKLAGGFYVSDMYPSIKMLQWIGGLRHKLEKVHEEADRIVGNILSDHKEKKITKSEPYNHEEEADDHQEDFVDILLKIQDSDQHDFPLTDSNIKAVLMDIFTAGSETSSTLVEWAMSEMLKNPRVMKEAQSEVRRVFHKMPNVDETQIHELKYLSAVIRETLRLHPPVPLLLPRESSRSCVIDGYDIPIKAKVLVNAWAIGRDPMHWFEAEKFWPERFLHDDGLHIDYKGTDFEFIPFGAGRRICPGMTFAMIVVELTLAQLLFHFDWKLPNDMKPEDLDMTEIFISLWKKTLKQAENSAVESLLLYMENLNMIKVLDLDRSIVDEYKVENDDLREVNIFLCQRIEELEDIVANEFHDEDPVEDNDDG
ncbi:hypothetical protein FNV43_RR02690 [Rhamnella rubrinervis]|uniref:Cytochrome P450 n=1 Tax=Rhamnella rubrinervis TaxID=2594499 RepID=A0A8K0HRX8_9ROSA|nr:hypothetical protein FNV43_RR02690 [Rhamnella rubrinervis]